MMAPLIRVAVHHRAARRERLGVAAKVEMEALILARPGVPMRKNPYAHCALALAETSSRS